MNDPGPYSYPFNQLLSKDVQEFIRLNENTDIRSLILKSKNTFGIPTVRIAEQIQGHRKAKEKLPLFYKTKNIIYPPTINLEQCSSEATAVFKSNLILTLFNHKPAVADLTGGFGVDAFFMAKHSHSLDMVEPDADLLSIAGHNHQVLDVSNISYHSQTAEEFLASTTRKYDLIFIDPSRRKDGKKLVSLSSCEPEVLSMLDLLLEKSSYILIKASPLLDIRQGIKELQNVQQVIVLSVDDECRELLFILSNNSSLRVEICAVGLTKTGEKNFSFSFSGEEEKSAEVDYSAPLTYLYEPDVTIFKTGAFKLVASRFNLKKLSKNSHLYTADELMESFPGRIFKVIQELKLTKKIGEEFDGGKANIISRNHPLSVEAIRKKTGLKEGGESYLICTRTETKSQAVKAERIN